MPVSMTAAARPEPSMPGRSARACVTPKAELPGPLVADTVPFSSTCWTPGAAASADTCSLLTRAAKPSISVKLRPTVNGPTRLCSAATALALAGPSSVTITLTRASAGRSASWAARLSKMPSPLGSASGAPAPPAA